MTSTERLRQRELHLAQRLWVAVRGHQAKIQRLDGLWRGTAGSCMGSRRDVPPLAPSRAAVEAVAPFLSHPDSEVRLSAAVALGTAAAHLEHVATALTRALSDASVGVRVQAMRAVRQLASLSDEQVAALRGALADPSREVRWMAAQALSRLAPDRASDWVMADWLVREGDLRRSPDHLGVLAPGRAAAYLAELERGGAHAAEAAELYGRIVGRDAPASARQRIEQQLREGGAPGFASALGRMGLPGEEALLRALAAPQAQVRRAAVWGLRVRRAAPPELVALLRDPDAGVQVETASLFCEQGALALASLQAWCAAQPAESLRELMLELHRSGGHVDALLQHLSDAADRRVRAWALTRIDRLAWRLNASK